MLTCESILDLVAVLVELLPIVLRLMVMVRMGRVGRMWGLYSETVHPLEEDQEEEAAESQGHLHRHHQGGHRHSRNHSHHAAGR